MKGLLVVAGAALLLLPAIAANGLDPAGAQTDPDPFPEALWDLEISALGKPELRSASGFSAVHLSPSGETLIVGLDIGQDGGVLFIDAQTGEVTATAQTKGHGPVRSVVSDDPGQVAGFIYESGYVAVADRDQNEPLVSRFKETGAPDSVRDRIALELSPDAQTLVMSTDRLQVYQLRGSPPNASFDPPVGDRYSSLGPHLFLHPLYPVVAAMDPEGRIGIYDLTLEPQIPAPMRLFVSQAEVADIAVSQDGRVFAVILTDGRVMKYSIDLEEGVPERLGEEQLRCTGSTCTGPFGVALDPAGARMLAWTNQEVLWWDPPSNSSDDPDEDGDEEPVRLHPEGDKLFAHVVPDLLLDRAVLTQADPEGRTRASHHGFPSGEPFEGELGQELDFTGVALHPVEGVVFLTHSTRLVALPVTASPEAGATGSDPGSPAGNGGGGGLFGLDLVTMMAGLGAVGVVAFLSVLVVAARRGDHGRLISQLELDTEGSSPTKARPSLPGGSPMSKVRLVTPSAPPEPEAPEGLLVLEDLHVQTHAPLRGLHLSLNRPGVVRLTGARELLAGFQSGLAGTSPTKGLVSAGGAQRASTPMLFASHMQIGLPSPSSPHMIVRDWYVQAGGRRRVPEAVVTRRLQADLGWMGARLDAPYEALSGSDRWRTRLAVAFSGRPKVLVLWTHELPAAGDPEDREKVRKVLFAVARRYGSVVVLLDPGGPHPEGVVRRWAHEEFRLTPSGFQDRLLLEEGRVVKTRENVAQNGRARPHRPSFLQRVVQDDRRRRGR